MILQPRIKTVHCAPNKMRKLLALLVLALVGAFAAAKEDLPADASLRIGIKHRPAECERKTKNGA